MLKSPHGDIPDVPGVIPDGAVSGKGAGAGHVHQGHLVPLLAVQVGVGRLLLGIAVAVEVSQKQVLVRRTAVSKEQTLCQVVVAHAVLEALGQCVHHRAQVVIVHIVFVGVVALGLELADLMGLETEEEDVLISQNLVHLDVGAVQGADGHGAVHHELHVAGAAGLLAGSGDLLAQFAGGHKLLGQRDPVVLQKDDLELILTDGVGVDGGPGS